MRLCFVTQTPGEIREGLRRLGEGLREGVGTKA
jgi:2-aminoadipate transaminase